MTSVAGDVGRRADHGDPLCAAEMPLLPLSLVANVALLPFLIVASPWLMDGYAHALGSAWKY